MSIEKSIVFLYPIEPVLSELKQKLQEDESYTLYEMDSIEEYKQLIGIVDHVITFSSDMKKTSRYLQETRQFITRAESFNIAITKITIPPYTFSKLQKFGLNEAHKESIALKTLEHKVNSFFKRFESKEEQKTVEKQKAQMSTDVLIMNKTDDENTHIDTQSRQHIERMGFMDEQKEEELKRKKVNLRGIEIGEGSASSNLHGKTSQSFNPAMGVLSSRKVKQLDLPDLVHSLKKGKKFIPVERDLKRKRGISFTPVAKELKRKKFNFTQVDQAAKKRKDFKPVVRELQHKKGKLFEPRQLDGKKRSHLKINEQELERKKGALFQKTEHQLKRKRLDLPEAEDNREKKKFLEVERESEAKKKVEFDEKIGNGKKGTFEEVARESKSQVGDVDHLDSHYRSRQAIEKEQKGPKRSKLESLEKDGEIKKQNDGDVITLGKKDWGEQTLNYATFKKEYEDIKKGNTPQEIFEKNKIFAQKCAQTPEIIYYYPHFNSIEYLAHIEAFYIDSKIEVISFFKFLHFSLIKNFEAIVSFYWARSEKLENLYCAHSKEDLSKIGIEKWEEYEILFFDEVKDIELPTWADETFQSKINRFVYPYFEAGELLGYALAHFPGTVLGHEQAKEVELILMTARGMMKTLLQEGR